METQPAGKDKEKALPLGATGGAEMTGIKNSNVKQEMGE